MSTSSSKRKPSREQTGKLRIGDDWNAINIIALSQSNPLKAVAEFVENSIDAHAKHDHDHSRTFSRPVVSQDRRRRRRCAARRRRHAELQVCRHAHLRFDQAADESPEAKRGIQGEFGIGLLSFWTVGESLTLVSAGSDGKAYEMRMAKGAPNYSVSAMRRLLPGAGTELTIQPLLPGIRHFSGEKLQWYLASELRDRIRQSGAEIRIVDRQARAEFRVEPRAFSGQLLHHLPTPVTSHGDVYVELYVAEPSAENQVGLYRSGTRVLESLTSIDSFQRPPWTTGYLQGVVDAPFLNLTPGSRLGVVHDERFAAFLEALGELETALDDVVRQQQHAAEETSNRETLRAIQRAFREALLVLPEEEYDWFEAYGVDGHRRKRAGGSRAGVPLTIETAGEPLAVDPTSGDDDGQRQFFEYAGPLFSVRISPATCTMPVNTARQFRAVARDRGGRQIDQNIACEWSVVEGLAQLTNQDGEIATLTAPDEPQLVRIRVCVRQDEVTATADSLITVTDSILPERPKSDVQGGLPEYTFEKRPGELWRSSIRRRAKRDCHQQRTPRFRLRRAKQVAQAPLHLPPVRQRARDSQLSRDTRRTNSWSE